MASTFTPNIQLEEPARGDDVGTWDTPVNANMTLLDLVSGGLTTIGLNNTPVVLSAAQFKCKTITFNSTLTGNVTITFPTSFTKSYEIQNACTGNFTITLATTAAGGQVICAPPGEITECLNDGANLKFKNFGRVGSFIDLYTITVPGWISGCTVPPYLNCNGTTFSSATYPTLATLLGGTTLPDSRGRVRAAMNQGSGRLVAIIVDSLGAGGGDQFPAIHTHTDAGHTHLTEGTGTVYGGTQTFAAAAGGDFVAVATPSALRGFNTGSGNADIGVSGTGLGANVQPTYMAGITLIRAA